MKRIMDMFFTERSPKSGASESSTIAPGNDLGLVPPPSNSDQDFVQDMVQMIAGVGTGLWRMRQKMLDSETKEPLEEMRRVFRHFESVWDAFIQAGVEIQDHTNEVYDSGLALRVIAFQPTPGIEREIITETIRPSIYFRKTPVQIGEVVVATPDA